MLFREYKDKERGRGLSELYERLNSSDHYLAIFRLDRWKRGRGQDRQLAASQQGRALATRLLQTWRLSFTSITRALCYLHSRQATTWKQG